MAYAREEWWIADWSRKNERMNSLFELVIPRICLSNSDRRSKGLPVDSGERRQELLENAERPPHAGEELWLQGYPPVGP